MPVTAGLAVAFALAVPAALAPAAEPSPLPESRTVLLGRSTEGRPIRAVRVGERSSPRKLLVVGVVHGNETAGLRVTRALSEAGVQPEGLSALRGLGRVAGADVWVVDSVNPDGVAHGRRQNARGVDPNRNFGRRWRRSARGSPYYSGSRPFSERESRIVRRWVERIRPAVTIW